MPTPGGHAASAMPSAPSIPPVPRRRQPRRPVPVRDRMRTASNRQGCIAAALFGPLRPLRHELGRPEWRLLQPSRSALEPAANRCRDQCGNRVRHRFRITVPGERDDRRLRFRSGLRSLVVDQQLLRVRGGGAPRPIEYRLDRIRLLFAEHELASQALYLVVAIVAVVAEGGESVLGPLGPRPPGNSATSERRSGTCSGRP